MAVTLARVTLTLTLTLLGSFATAQSASAHGGDETSEAYLLVQQALGHLAHDTGMDGIDLAMEKVHDALDTDDQEGVDVAEVEQGMTALEAGDVDRARSLLQDSIKAAVRDLPPATGTQTGTKTVSLELPGRSGLDAQDWAFLGASIVVLLLGAWVSVLFRPAESVRRIRARLAVDGSGPVASGTEQEDR